MASHLDSAFPAAAPIAPLHIVLAPLKPTRCGFTPQSPTFPQHTAGAGDGQEEAIILPPWPLHPEGSSPSQASSWCAKKKLVLVASGLLLVAAMPWSGCDAVEEQLRAAHKSTLAAHSISKHFDLLRK